MADSTFAHATWLALSAVEDHFARLGGKNCYPGFEVTHPSLFVVAMLAANASAPTHELSWTPESLHHALRRLRIDAPRLWHAMQALEPWNPARFPAALLHAAGRPLGGVTPTAADLRDFAAYLDSRLPNIGSPDRDALREALRELAARCGGSEQAMA